MTEAVILFARALDFAARAHAGQRRKGARREPYVNHLTEVALLLAEATGGRDGQLIAAGLLHDVVEDTEVTHDDVSARFGPAIAGLVAEVTDDKDLPKTERKQLQVATVRAKSVRARMIKLADKISNLRALTVSPPEDWNSDEIDAYIAWAREVAAGCAGVHAELETRFHQALAAALSTRD
jgi:(p)ppGpp synthase/HD superfamily hydrolase